MDPFADPRSIAALLADLHHPWFICGGWAIDLLLNRVTRAHKDVDVAVLRRDQAAVQTYLNQRGWTLEKAVDGRLIPWAAGEWIGLPVHVIWCRQATFKPGFFELLFNEVNDTHFLFRRDQSIVRARERMSVRSASGLPILAPEIVLLYKAKDTARENNADFQHTLPLLDAERRAWLQSGLQRLHPAHPWLRYF